MSLYNQSKDGHLPARAVYQFLIFQETTTPQGTVNPFDTSSNHLQNNVSGVAACACRRDRSGHYHWKSGSHIVLLLMLSARVSLRLQLLC